MKKLLAVLLTLTMALSMVACSSSNANSETSSKDESSTSSSTESSQEESQEESQDEGETGTLVSDEKMDAAYNAMIEAVFGDDAENVKAMLAEIPAEQFEVMTNISLDLIANLKAGAPMMSAQDDTIIIIKAAEGKAADVETALKAYKENNIKMKDPAQGGMSYPGQLEKAQAAQIAVVGDYVMYVSIAKKDIEEGDELIELLNTHAQLAVDTAKELLK